MKLSAAFEVVLQLSEALQIAFYPTLSAIFKSPFLLFHPQKISRIFMSHVWTSFGNGVDENSRPFKEELITAKASGVVLDIGAGHGHTVLYLDPSKVAKYVALEPNAHMHAEIRVRAAAKGFTEAANSLVILPYGAEDIALIVSALGGRHTVDTMIAVLTLCSIPDPQRVLDSLVDDVLKPGGMFLMYEHVLSGRADVAWWQRFWTPVWKRAFDGCCLDRPTHVWVAQMDAWAERSVYDKDGEDEENLWWHQIGRFVKKGSSA